MEKLMTVKELSNILGYSVRTIYAWIYIEFSSHYKFPKGVRFIDLEIEKWLKKRERHGSLTYQYHLVNCNRKCDKGRNKKAS